MRKRNGIIFMAVMVSIFLCCSVVTAESLTDPSGDVYHWKSTGSGFQWEAATSDRANIDITELSFTSNGEQLTLTMKVAGTIQSSETISYIAWVNVSDSYYYWMTYMNGEGGGFAINSAEGTGQYDYDPDISVNGDTLSATFDIIGDDPTQSDFWGWAAEYTVMNDITSEWWGDWIPGDYAPFYGDIDDDDDQSGDDDPGGDDESGGDDTGDETGGDDTGGDSGGDDTAGDSEDDGTTPPPPSTPGFELVALISALALILIIIRKRE